MLHAARWGSTESAPVLEGEIFVDAGAHCLMISHSFSCKAKIRYLYD